MIGRSISNAKSFEECEFELFQKIVGRSLEKFNSIDDFYTFLKTTVKELIPHEFLLIKIERIVFDQLHTERSLIVDYQSSCVGEPKSFSDICQKEFIKNWLINQKPVAISFGGFQKDFCGYKVNNLILHGQVDICGRMAAVCGFVNSVPVDDRYSFLVEAVMPYIQRALVNSLTLLSRPEKKFDLSVKEYEVLEWIVMGRTNKEIGKILNKSDRTVRNQVSSILEKLGADNRSQIMIRAEQAGLLSKWSANYSMFSDSRVAL